MLKCVDGRKVKILAKNPKVSVVFVGAGVVISKVFTTEFESAVVAGKVKLVEDKDERIKALKLICEKYTPTKMSYFPLAIKAGLNRTNVYSLEIEEITAKRKKFNANGEELKHFKLTMQEIKI